MRKLLVAAILVSLCSAATFAANVYVASTGNDSTCVRNDSSKPCASFSGAYTKALGGDIVEVAAGTYGSQSLPSSSKGTSVITFMPAAGAAVTLGGLGISASYVEVQNMKVVTGQRIYITPATSGVPSSTHHVTLRNITGMALYMVAEDVLVKGGDYGGFDACSFPNAIEDVIQIWQENGKASSRITFDGVTIHDVSDRKNQCSGTTWNPPPHVDCMQIFAGHNITIRNSNFYNCATSDILARPYLDTLNDLTFENNFFGEVTNPGSSINLGADSDAIGGINVVRYNTITGGLSSAFASGLVQIYGNILQTGSCTSGNSYSYNIFLPGWSVQCGTNSKLATPSFVGPTPSPVFMNGIVPNYHLASNDTVALNAGDPARYPAIDYDGQLRFIGAAPDAGADEIGGTAPPVSFPHPADTNSDFLMALNEATKYGACWKNPAAYADCPTGITIDYAVRAGTLWAATATGQYQYNSGTACPSCWERKP